MGCVIFLALKCDMKILCSSVFIVLFLHSILSVVLSALLWESALVIWAGAPFQRHQAIDS